MATHHCHSLTCPPGTGAPEGQGGSLVPAPLAWLGAPGLRMAWGANPNRSAGSYLLEFNRNKSNHRPGSHGQVQPKVL